MKTQNKLSNTISKQCSTARVLGIVSMSTAIIGAGLIVGVVALVFACMGRKKAKNPNDLKNANTGLGLAIGGIILGTIMTIIFTIGFMHVSAYIWNHVVW